MKKQFLFLAGSALLLISCGSNNSNNQQQTQAQIDSTVNAKLAQHDAENASKNDSTLKAMENEKAAGMAKEREQSERSHTGGGNKKSNTNGANPPSPNPQTVGNGKPSMTNQNSNTTTNTGTVGNGKPSMK